jgi:hypothetical protein
MASTSLTSVAKALCLLRIGAERRVLTEEETGATSNQAIPDHIPDGAHVGKHLARACGDGGGRVLSSPRKASEKAAWVREERDRETAFFVF